MSEQHLLLAGAFLIGLTLGIIAMLMFNKVRGGSVSPGALKQEMEDYQGEVEAHFEQTSQKFQQMATQYQDLYQHLSMGATSLCRPENISPELTDQRDPLGKSNLIEQAPIAEQEPVENKASAESKIKEPSVEQKEPSVEQKKPSVEQDGGDAEREAGSAAQDGEADAAAETARNKLKEKIEDK